MRFAKIGLVVVFCFCSLGASSLFAQSVGNIVGLVVDASGGAISKTTMKVTNSEIGVERAAQTNESGTYVVTALLPAEYDVTVETPGFKRTVKHTTVNVGRDVTVDFALEVGETTQTVNVEAEAVAINLTDAKVAGTVTNADVTNLPLNGRNAYELAKLVPGVVVKAQSGRNSEISVSISGSLYTRFMIDGANVTDNVTSSLSSYNLSQEVVQEFQVNTNNGDPSNGVGQAGTINIITRSGGNDFHGTGWSFFRNNQYAAFPGLARPTPRPNPTNDPTIAAFNESQAHPPFHRYQYGAMLSGPILRRKRLYWLASFENSPTQVVTAFKAGPPFDAMSELIASPHNRLDENYRVDWTATDKNSFFWRISWDRMDGTFIPTGAASTANILDDRATAYLMGWTSVLSNSLVADVRVGFDRLEYNEYVHPAAVSYAEQFAPALLNQTVPYGFTTSPWMGFVSVIGTNLSFGNPATGHSDEDIPRSQLIGNVTWTKGSHTFKFGADIERAPWYLKWITEQPFSTTLFNPTQAAAAGISVPATYNNLGDVLQLPVASFSMGIGHPNVTHDQFQHQNIDVTHQFHFYVADSYRVTRTLTFNYSLGWSYFGNVTNWDLPKPKLLSKVFNGDLDPTPNFRKGIAPVVGIAWDPRGQGKTVIRAGAGVYYGLLPQFTLKPERGYISPLGDSYVSIPGTFIVNPLPGETGVLNFRTAKQNHDAGIVRLADLIPYIPGIRLGFDQIFTNTNTDLSVTNFDYFKGTSATGGAVSGQLISPHVRPPVSYQNSLGVQQQFGRDWFVSVSGVLNFVNHTFFSQDLNLKDRPAARGGPIDLLLGYVVTQVSGGQSIYKGLLVNTQKRMSNHWGLVAAYTYSRNITVGSGLLLDYTNWGANYGPDPNDITHAFLLDATYQLPWGFEASLISEMRSRPPFNVFLSQIDLRGDGTTNDLLPGIPFDSINRSKSVDDLRAAVNSFNATYAATRDARNTIINPINLPADIRTGRAFIDQDIRVSKTFKFGERVSAKLTAECFNVFNYGNLTFVPASGNLYNRAFGQPSQRINSTAGSGGPRAFQFGIRGSF